MKLRIILLVVGVVTLFVLNIFFGSVHIDAADVLQTLLHGGASNEAVAYIILGSRLPTAMTAMLAGAGLATAGLLLQTSFHNPLAGPSILGISSGANLGVAIWAHIEVEKNKARFLGIDFAALKARARTDALVRSGIDRALSAADGEIRIDIGE